MIIMPPPQIPTGPTVLGTLLLNELSFDDKDDYYKPIKSMNKISKIQELHKLKVFVYKNLYDFRDIFSEIKDISFEYDLDMTTDKDYTYISNDNLEVFINTLKQLDDIFDNYLGKLENIVDKSIDYKTYTASEKNIVILTANIAKTIKSLCDVPIIDENDKVTRKSRRVLRKAELLIEKLEVI